VRQSQVEKSQNVKNMEMTINIGYNQVLDMIYQMPKSDITRLLKKLQSEFSISRTQATEKTEWQQLLLQAPTWTDEEYNNYLSVRKEFI